jgi:hypothetical protein
VVIDAGYVNENNEKYCKKDSLSVVENICLLFPAGFNYSFLRQVNYANENILKQLNSIMRPTDNHTL